MCDKKSDPVLTEYDITINSIHQENMFKGTITVCIIYASFAFILICAAYFSDNIRELLFDKFLPFTLIYIIGTIIIIMIFVQFILSFKPKKIDFDKVDENISCPDYWKLEVLDDKAIETSFDISNFNKKLFKYRCVMDDNVFDKGIIYKQDKNATPAKQYKLGNKPAFISPDVSNNTAYTDIYDGTKSTEVTTFLTNTDDKYLYLYKNLNAYNDNNLIYTGNSSISSNILNDLKESALIMNNYGIDSSDKNNPTTKYNDLTNYGANGNTDSTALNTRYTSNYYNSPPILTWATSNAKYSTNDASGSYNNIAIVTNNTANNSYTATVYDWSTMTNLTARGNVYAIDTNATSGAGVDNYILLGQITSNTVNKQIYFQGNTSVTIPSAQCFIDKISANSYYFDVTYIVSTTLTTPKKYIDSDVTNFDKGPKVRLFHKSERQPEILTKNLVTENIPLTCSAVYPTFLASKENKYAENNTLRCAYSKVCNIPWSDLHCNDIKDFA
jgi:hypothetical protein